MIKRQYYNTDYLIRFTMIHIHTAFPLFLTFTHFPLCEKPNSQIGLNFIN